MVQAPPSNVKSTIPGPPVPARVTTATPCENNNHRIGTAQVDVNSCVNSVDSVDKSKQENNDDPDLDTFSDLVDCLVNDHDQNNNNNEDDNDNNDNNDNDNDKNNTSSLSVRADFSPLSSSSMSSVSPLLSNNDREDTTSISEKAITIRRNSLATTTGMYSPSRIRSLHSAASIKDMVSSSTASASSSSSKAQSPPNARFAKKGKVPPPPLPSRAGRKTKAEKTETKTTTTTTTTTVVATEERATETTNITMTTTTETTEAEIEAETVLLDDATTTNQEHKRSVSTSAVAVASRRRKQQVSGAPMQITHMELVVSVITEPNDAGASLLASMIESSALDTRKINDNTVQHGIAGTSTDTPACTLLHLAAKANNVECMQVLVRYGASVNSRDAISATPLHYACSSNSHEAVVFLLMNGANVQAKDEYECFPLLLALKRDSMSMARMLLLQKADIHLRGKRGNTILHFTAQSGKVNQIDVLIGEFGASLLRLNDSHETPLFCALSHPNVVQKLCDYACSQGIMGKLAGMKDGNGRTVFHECAEKGYLDSMVIILESLSTKATDVEQVDNYLLLRLNELSRDGFTPLHYATIADRYPIVQFLCMIKSVQIHKLCLQSHSALHYALSFNSMNIAKLLTSILTEEACTDVEKKKSKAVSRLRASLSKASSRLSQRLSNRFPQTSNQQENI